MDGILKTCDVCNHKADDIIAALRARNQILLEALDTLVAIVGLTAFKHEGQRAVLQEAVDGAIAALKLARS